LTKILTDGILLAGEKMLYFVRHGETDGNKKGIIQGGTDFPLNETGFAQANEAKEKLKGVRFDKAFCSPLLRAKQTCAVIYSGNAESDERISERRFGNYEGVAPTERDFAAMWDFSREDEFPEVERVSDLKSRVYSFLDDVVKNYSGKTVLVVSHGGAGYFFKTYFRGTSDEGLRRRFYGNGETDIFEI